MMQYNALQLQPVTGNQKTTTRQIIKALEGKIEDGDFVVVSEKAISTALGCMVDESTVKPSLTRELLRVFGCGLSGGILLEF